MTTTLPSAAYRAISSYRSNKLMWNNKRTMR